MSQSRPPVVDRKLRFALEAPGRTGVHVRPRRATSANGFGHPPYHDNVVNTRCAADAREGLRSLERPAT